MISYSGTLEKAGEMGEKSGWTFLIIPHRIAHKINPGIKKAFRVKGKLNGNPVKGITLLPIGKGDFMLPFNAALRKLTGKKAGDKINVILETDSSPRKLDEDFLLCLDDDQSANTYFKSLTPSHQQYFSNWISTAKTEPTKAKRIATALNALSRKMDFGAMLREAGEKRKREVKN